ncbi:hypothetical protein LH435_05120 [Laribacter hongkongensis]|uniref:hypothetical protein n=1 Tax=Laribacter hongkongensis TaxID=168471 RepID=UPI001EFDF41E|nr:hypothetical protein [Laribacter hongkongensis]MCG8994443.1 hypothetical protein [Laribacter hongkongensis]MCG9011514.1 hypothetical protein [Laribacter hongkongensis]MCG9046974.1 hypothetical protein [Laribacter hongkongensis]MCG9073407.1 hypothetical protein [Laribacter hongkongensis]
MKFLNWLSRLPKPLMLALFIVATGCFGLSGAALEHPTLGASAALRLGWTAVMVLAFVCQALAFVCQALALVAMLAKRRRQPE